MAEPSWRVQLLGRLALQRGENVITRFRTVKTGSLLAYLAYFRKYPQPREVLVDLLWPEATAQAGRNRLSVALSSLRSQVEPYLGPEPAENAALIVSDNHAVQLHPAVLTDTAELEQWLDRAAQTRNVAARLGHLREAVTLYQGDLLPGYYEEWIVPEQERLRNRFLQAVQEAATGGEQVGMVSEALELVLQALAVAPEADPLQEIAARLRHRHPASVAPAPPKVPVVPAIVAPTLAAGGVRTWLVLEREGGEDAPLLAQLPQFGGEVRRLMPGLLAASFAQSARALEAVTALLPLLVPPDSAPTPFRMALDLGEVAPEEESGAAEPSVDSPLWRLPRLLAVGTRPNTVLCSEALAPLLRRSLVAPATLTPAERWSPRPDAPEEALFALWLPGMPVPEASPPADWPPAASIPRPTTEFFGREVERDYLEQTLRPQGSQLLTLIGPGGIGKTRLALETARRLLPHWNGRVCFVPLADLRDPRDILPRLRDALRLAAQPGTEPLAQIVATLSEAPTLLVLDNAEHLVDPTADIVHRLLTQTPGLGCLVTSRVHLNLGGERLVPVHPLPVPRRGERIDTNLATRYPALQLFVDRARAVRPDFHLTTGNIETVSALCRLLEGAPLALELVAARIAVLTPAQMLAQVGERLTELQSRRRDAPERHRSLRLSFEWSYGLLAPELQRLFTQLSLFRGGWTLAAAQAVCRPDGTDDPTATSEDLLALLECSLIVRDESGPEEAEPRFRMLEMLRQFGEELLQRDDAPDGLTTVRERHRGFYRALAEESEPYMQGAGELQAQWLERLQQEMDNFRAALAEPSAEGLRMAAALHRFWMIRGYLEEGLRSIDAQINAGGETAPPEVRAKAWNGAGILAWVAGDFTTAERCFTGALELERQLGNDIAIARCLNNLGIVANLRGDLETALHFYEESLTQYRLLNDSARTSLVLNNLALLQLHFGKLDAARAMLEESLELRGDSDVLGNASTLQNLAFVASRLGDHAAAARYLLASLEVRRERDDRSNIAGMLWLSAAILVRAAVHTEAAARLFGAAEAVGAELKTPLALVDREEYQVLMQECSQRCGAANYAAFSAEGSHFDRESALTFAQTELKNLAQGMATGTA